MPNLNGTGPQGNGKLTGRGLGNCQESNNDDCRRNGLGFKRRGCGNGAFSRNQMQGRGRGVWNVDSSTDEIQMLKNRISELETKLEKDNK